MSDEGKRAYVPGFQYDVFVSYAWVNNYPQRDDQPESGWVTQFKTKLQQRVDEKLGRTGAASFFFDRVRLGKNQDFNPQIEAAVHRSALFVAVFSDGYIASPGCGDEIAHFNKTVGGDLSRSGRLFLVRIDDVDPKGWPDEFKRYLNNVIGYEFFIRDPINQWPTRVSADHEHYASSLQELRSSLAAKLKQMRQEGERIPPDAPKSDVSNAAPDEPRAKVLLAQSTPDLRKQRKQLIAYCESAELRVLGGPPYPPSADQFRDAFVGDLNQAHVVVQLLGECYSDRTEDFPLGIEQWQLEQARQANLPILQWRDASLPLEEVDDDHHHDLLCGPDVRTDPPAAFHKDVVERARRAFDVGKAPVETGETWVALVKFSESDERPTMEMVEMLKQSNVLCRSTRSGRPPLVDRLREIPFDALIVVLGDCSEEWLEERGDELLAVELNFKDQAPMQAYYFCGDNKLVPPFVGLKTLRISGPGQLDQLVEAIRTNGGRS